MDDIEVDENQRVKEGLPISFVLWFLAFIPGWFYVVFWTVLTFGGWLMSNKVIGFCLKGVGASFLCFLVFYAIYFLYKKYSIYKTNVRRSVCRANSNEHIDNEPREDRKIQSLLQCDSYKEVLRELKFNL